MQVKSFLYSIPDKLPQIYTGKKPKEENVIFQKVTYLMNRNVTYLMNRFGKYLPWGDLHSNPKSTSDQVRSFFYYIPDKLSQIYTGKKPKKEGFILTSQKVKDSMSRFGKYLSWGILYNTPLIVLSTIALTQAKNYSEATKGIEELFYFVNNNSFLDSIGVKYSDSFKIYSIFKTGLLVVPIKEEIIYRLIIQGGTKRISKYAFSKISDWKEKGKDEKYSSVVSRITSAVLFANKHLSNAPLFGKEGAIFQAINMGILSYWITKAFEEDGLMGAIGVHMGNNFHTTVPPLLGLLLGKTTFQK